MTGFGSDGNVVERELERGCNHDFRDTRSCTRGVVILLHLTLITRVNCLRHKEGSLTCISYLESGSESGGNDTPSTPTPKPSATGRRRQPGQPATGRLRTKKEPVESIELIK